MKPNMTKEAIDARFEAQVRARARKLMTDPSAKNIHYILDAKENLPLRVFNQVAREQAKRKIN